MGIIMLDEYARPKEQRATFPDIASRELSIVKKKEWLMAVFRYIAFYASCIRGTKKI